ncbi:MAG: GNAT family N-acetyltransferase [Syntrophomonadaceae bacterium]|nr:GNAT family N-acetyltransferase [Syntrophomonadaceae bacterium]
MHFRSMERKDQDSVMAFIENNSSKKRSLSEWDWEFNLYNQLQQVFVVAEENNDIIGTQALLPIPLIRAGKTILSAKSEETLVHQEQRGKNVFSQMYALVFAKAISNGIQMIWGFTGANKPFSKIGFSFFDKGLSNYWYVTSVTLAYKQYCLHNGQKTLKGILKRLIYLLILSFIKIKGVLSFPGSKNIKYHIALLNEFDAVTDQLKNSISRDLPDLITVDRDSQFMNWRVGQNPYYDHQVVGLYHISELVGYAVLAMSEHSWILDIMDIVLRPDHFEHGLPALVDELQMFATKQKWGCINFQLMPCSNEYSVKVLAGVKKAGFFRSIGGMQFILKILNNNIKHLYQDVNKWYVTGIMTEGIVHRKQ